MADNKNNGYETIDFLTELLEKLVEAQILQSERLAVLNVLTESNGENIMWIKGQFTNGFRSEIKTHITSAVDVVDKDLAVAATNVDKKLDILMQEVAQVKSKIKQYSSPKFLAKVLIALMISFAVFVTLTHSVYDIWKEHFYPVISNQAKLDRLQQQGDKNDTSTRPW